MYYCGHNGCERYASISCEPEQLPTGRSNLIGSYCNRCDEEQGHKHCCKRPCPGRVEVTKGFVEDLNERISRG